MKESTPSVATQIRISIPSSVTLPLSVDLDFFEEPLKSVGFGVTHPERRRRQRRRRRSSEKFPDEEDEDEEWKFSDLRPVGFGVKHPAKPKPKAKGPARQSGEKFDDFFGNLGKRPMEWGVKHPKRSDYTRSKGSRDASASSTVVIKTRIPSCARQIAPPRPPPSESGATSSRSGDSTFFRSCDLV